MNDQNATVKGGRGTRTPSAGTYAIWWQLADGSTAAERLSPELNVPVMEAVLSPDGKTLLYRVDTPDRARDIYAMPMAGDRTPRDFLVTEFDEFVPRFSPDGRWVTYVSNEAGRDEVYLRPFPEPGGRVLVSSGGGEEPVWSRDGKRILFRTRDAVIAAPITFSSVPVVSRRDTIIERRFCRTAFIPCTTWRPTADC